MKKKVHGKTIVFLIYTIGLWGGIEAAASAKDVLRANTEILGTWMVVQNNWVASSSADKEILTEIFFWEISSEKGQSKIANMSWDFQGPYRKIIADIQTGISSKPWFPDHKLLVGLPEKLVLKKIHDSTFASSEDYHIHLSNIPSVLGGLKVDPGLKMLIVSQIFTKSNYPFNYLKFYMANERESDYVAGGFRSRSKIGKEVVEKEGIFKMYRVTRIIRDRDNPGVATGIIPELLPG